MTHSPETPQRHDIPTPVPRILLTENEKAASSSIDLNKNLTSDSALEVDIDDIVSRQSIPERIRRRSELRQKPVFTTEEFELPVLSPLPEGPQTPAALSDDVELASALPDTSASSLRDDSNSTVPVLSPAQEARHRWRGRLHFFAVCYCSFIQGWNDGSTGPLLPTIQRYYNVRILLRVNIRVNTITDRLRYCFSIVRFQLHCKLILLVSCRYSHW